MEVQEDRCACVFWKIQLDYYKKELHETRKTARDLFLRVKELEEKLKELEKTEDNNAEETGCCLVDVKDLI